MGAPCQRHHRRGRNRAHRRRKPPLRLQHPLPRLGRERMARIPVALARVPRAPVRDAALRVHGHRDHFRAAARMRGSQAAADRYLRAFGRSCWAIDNASLDGDLLTISGWALAPWDGVYDVAFTANGRLFDEQRYPLERGDLTDLLWFRLDARESGFECRIRLTPSELASQAVTLHLADRATLLPFDETHAWYMPTPASADRSLPLPESPRLLRTTGHDNVTNFRL